MTAFVKWSGRLQVIRNLGHDLRALHKIQKFAVERRHVVNEINLLGRTSEHHGQRRPPHSPIAVTPQTVENYMSCS